MGLFGSRKKTYVSSVTYPLGEDDQERTGFVKKTVINATLQEQSIGESLTQGILRGQGLTLRNVFPYARDKYTHGVPKSVAVYADQPDLTVLTNVLKAENSGKNIEIITNMVGTADFMWWAEKYLTDKFGYDRVAGEFVAPPAGVEHDAAVTYDLEPDGRIIILLMNSNGSTHSVQFRPEGYVRMANYVHAVYRTKQNMTLEESQITRPADPGEVDTVSTTVEVIERVGDTQTITTQIYTEITGSDAVVTTRKTAEVLSRPKYFIYRVGSGTHPEMDEWLSGEDLSSPYYPSIPLRVDNKDWTSAQYQNTPQYKTSKKLLDKVGLSIEDLSDSINSNENVSEIDYAFVTFGVSLKTRSQEGMRYLYRFFQHLRNISTSTSVQFSGWLAAYNDAISSGGNVTSPQTNILEIYSPKNRENHHDIKLQWQYIDTLQKSGTIFEGAKPGDVILIQGAVRDQITLLSDLVLDKTMLRALKQIDEDTYEELQICGLVYENRVYRGHSVIITAWDAFNDEEEEGFIIPLNQGIIRETPLVELTDLAHQCMYMVFNCYKVVKKKWYQTGLFKVIMVIVAIIVVVISWGAATPAAMAMLGAAGMALVVLSATIYVLSMMVLMKVLGVVATELFGEKWGAIIAMIVMFVAMNWGELGAMAAQASAQGVTSIITAQSVMQASTMILNAYGSYAGAKIKEIQQKAMGMWEEFDEQMKEIEDLFKMNLDTSLDMIDIQGYTDATYVNLFEKSDTFLGRTLLTGSDVAAITEGMITDYAAVGLRLPDLG